VIREISSAGTLLADTWQRAGSQTKVDTHDTLSDRFDALRGT